jgi:hypothetical protein
LSTIRAYQEQRRFIAGNMAKMDASNRRAFLSFGSRVSVVGVSVGVGIGGFFLSLFWLFFVYWCSWV